MNYYVEITGELREGVDRASALLEFAALFKIDEAKAEAMLEKAPVTVKKDIDKATAEKFVAAIEKVGFTCRVLSDETSLAASSSAEQTTPTAPTVASPIVQPEQYMGWTYTIEGQPDYSFLTVQIPANETLKVEASSMATMDTNLQMKTKFKGGLGRFLTGENIFINEFTAAGGSGEIGIAPGTPGDMMHQYLDNDTIYLQSSAFVAATKDVAVESKWQGMVKGFFSGESLFLIRCSGRGDLWFNTYGAIIEIDVTDDYVVDTGNIVAFTEGLDYKVSKVGGYKSLFFSGEGFVCRFTGKGKVWIQTRSASAFTWWAHFYRPVKSSN
ncbi:hypothetical protein TDB9533_01826 [Thalassocella blandensis]|nr:hypothetical protein TDB9533_01826 [Thalassocella blandensis]